MLNLIEVNNTLKLIFQFKRKKRTKELVDRFYQLFNDHGIQATEIPNLIPEITLDVLEKDKKLLSILTNEKIAELSKLFNVKETWLRGNGSVVYERLSCYKRPHYFFEKLSELKKRDSDSPVFAITSKRVLDYKKNQTQPICLVFREHIHKINDMSIDRYHIWSDPWNWSYSKTRLQLKALARQTYYNFGSAPIPVYYLDEKYIEKIREGIFIPHKIIINATRLPFGLEDFSDSFLESKVAKEVDELPYVLEYINKHKL